MTFERVIAGERISAGQPVTTRRRPWPERLLSWPWRPWIARKAGAVELEPNYSNPAPGVGGVTYQHNAQKAADK